MATADRLVALRSWAHDLAATTGMFFDQGRVYYTLAGSGRLFYRYFTPGSGVVGATRLVASGPVPGFDASRARGLFLASDTLFWRTEHGDLHSVGWQRGWPAGRPRGPAGPTWDGSDGGWGSHALFVLAAPDTACRDH